MSSWLNGRLLRIPQIWCKTLKDTHSSAFSVTDTLLWAPESYFHILNFSLGFVTSPETKQHHDLGLVCVVGHGEVSCCDHQVAELIFYASSCNCTFYICCFLSSMHLVRCSFNKMMFQACASVQCSQVVECS